MMISAAMTTMLAAIPPATAAVLTPPLLALVGSGVAEAAAVEADVALVEVAELVVSLVDSDVTDVSELVSLEVERAEALVFVLVLSLLDVLVAVDRAVVVSSSSSSSSSFLGVFVAAGSSLSGVGGDGGGGGVGSGLGSKALEMSFAIESRASSN
jgi:hypothetical protein